MAVVIFIVVLGISFFVSHSISSRIITIRDAAGKVGRGKLDTRISADSKDELGELAASFNTMASGLKKTSEAEKRAVETEKKRAQELLRLKSELEKIVSERTKELRQQVQKLTKGRRAMLYMIEDLNRTSKELKETTVSRDELTEEVARRKDAEEKMREAMDIKSEFTSMVSHELRTPLTAIKESVNIVYEGVAGKLNNDQKKLLSVTMRSTDRLSRLVNDVLDFQKLETGRMIFVFQEHDINDTMKEVYDAMLPLAKKDALDFNIIYDEKIPKVRFDKDKIIQVITNLVNNAVKFTEKGSITIRSSMQGNIVQVSVQDTGYGIKEKDMPRLFQRFEQLEKGKNRKIGGSGLGLALSREIIRGHKGRIWAESTFGKGSTFYFVLPIKERRS